MEETLLSFRKKIDIREVLLRVVDFSQSKSTLPLPLRMKLVVVSYLGLTAGVSIFLVSGLIRSLQDEFIKKTIYPSLFITGVLIFNLLLILVLIFYWAISYYGLYFRRQWSLWILVITFALAIIFVSLSMLEILINGIRRGELVKFLIFLFIDILFGWSIYVIQKPLHQTYFLTSDQLRKVKMME